jgi:hypothetical protein
VRKVKHCNQFSVFHVLVSQLKLCHLSFSLSSLTDALHRERALFLKLVIRNGFLHLVDSVKIRVSPDLNTSTIVGCEAWLVYPKA